MDRNRLDTIIALIQERRDFPFDALDVEEDLHVILAHYGVLDDYSLQQEFVIKEALLAFIGPWKEGLHISGHGPTKVNSMCDNQSSPFLLQQAFRVILPT